MQAQNERLELMKDSMLLKPFPEENDINQFEDSFGQQLFLEVHELLKDIKNLQLHKAVLDDNVKEANIKTKQNRISGALNEFSSSCHKQSEEQCESILAMWQRDMANLSIKSRDADGSMSCESQLKFIKPRYKHSVEDVGKNEELYCTVQYKQFWTDIQIIKRIPQELQCNQLQNMCVKSSIFVENLEELILSCLIEKKSLVDLRRQIEVCITQHIHELKLVCA